MTLKELAERFLEARADDMSEIYYRDNCRYLREYWAPLHDRAVAQIRRADAVNVLDVIAVKHGKPTADRCRSALSSFFGWVIDRGFAEQNPLIHVKSRANGHRDRTLNDKELSKVWCAVANLGDYERIVKLLILTGQRKTEIAHLKWSEIDFEKAQIELSSHRTKNGRPHVLPLSKETMCILQSVPERAGRNYVFGEGERGYQGWSKSKHELDANLGKIEPWRLHDLRRSVVTGMHEHDIAQPHVIEAAVNHVSGAHWACSGTTRRDGNCAVP